MATTASPPSLFIKLADLQPFFRGLTIYINVVVMGVSLAPYPTIIGIIVAGLEFFALIFNIVVLLQQRRQQQVSTSIEKGSASKESILSRIPSVSRVAIGFDFLFASFFLGAWIVAIIFSLDVYGGIYYLGGLACWSYLLVGSMLSWHLHFFFGIMAINIRRQKQQQQSQIAETASRRSS